MLKLEADKMLTDITQSNFTKLKEDIQFLDNVLKIMLVTYQGYFQEQFIEGLSICKYAEAHQIDCGSADYL